MSDKDGCGGCDIGGDRRDFIRYAATFAAGALIGLGASPSEAVAAPLRRVFGERGKPDGEVRFPVPAADGASIDKENGVILARHNGAVYAFALSCPHQNTALHWQPEEHRFQCPKHKSIYQMDGVFVSGRATRNMDRLPIRLDGTTLVVDVDHVFESDKDGASWAAAMVKVA